jgi:hypothetical protein
MATKPQKFRADTFDGPLLRGDAAVFFARELEEIDSTLYDVKYAELEAFQLVSPKKLGEATEQYTYRQYDGRGVAKMTSNYANGSPRADVEGVEFTSKVRSIRASFGYNIQEIRAARATGRPLENMRAIQARRAINEKINKVALLGDAEHNLIGLFNQPNVQTYTVPAVGNENGGTNSTQWIHKTGEQILDDLYGMVDQVPDTTVEIEKVTRLLIPYKRLRFISRKRAYTDGSDKASILSVFQQERPDVQVRGALFLDTAGASSTCRAIGYNPASDHVELLLPIPFESFPPQLSGMEYVVECHARMGGVVNRYPLAMIYADGI